MAPALSISGQKNQILTENITRRMQKSKIKNLKPLSSYEQYDFHQKVTTKRQNHRTTEPQTHKNTKILITRKPFGI